MIRRYALTMFLLVLSLYGLNAQQVIKLGSGNLTLEDNVGVRGRALPMSAANHAQLMVLRFDNLPTAKQKAELRRQGIELHSYISHNLYYATVKGNPAEVLPATRTRGAMPGVRQANVVDPLWKINPEVSSGRIPEWAQGSRASEARMVVEFFKGMDAKLAAKQLADNGIRVLKMMDKFRMAEVEMPVDKALRVAAFDWVRLVGFVSPPVEPENAESRTISRSNLLSQPVNLGGYGLTGRGQDVGLWDGSVEPHPDFGNRLVTHEFEYNSSHGQHTAGTLAGAGILDPRAKGMAPEATLHTWNFNTQSNGLSVPEEMLISARDYNVRLTSNSYGVYMTSNGQDRWCVNKYPYTSSDAMHDMMTNELYPDLLHIFSGGNDQDACLNFTNSRYETSTKRVKNSILVGALQEDGSMSSYSSWGPMNDGRMLPHISVSGSNTFSTVYGMKYEDGWNGTSMACPAAAGTMTLLYQLYEQIHGVKPLAALAKAVMLNSGHDRGNEGPDYQYGFGVLDGLRSARMIERKQHFVDAVEHGDSVKFSIDVPAGTVELRVMLVWSDVAAAENAKPALVNDLDLTVVHNGNSYLPWLLNPKYPENPALKGYDRLNNQEQVTITNPAAGTYTIKVNGYAVPEGPQQFAIAYDCYSAGVELTYPNGDEAFAPNAKVLARWNTDGLQEPISIDISTDGGVTFSTLLSNVPANQTEAIVTMPDVATDKAMMRIRQGSHSDISNGAFVIMGVPQNLKVSMATPCDASSFQLVWNSVPGAAQYAVFKADEAKAAYNEIGRVSDTIFSLPAMGNERNLYSVVAISASGVAGERSVAAVATPSHPLNLTTLPFEENFENFLSPYVSIILGEHTTQDYLGMMYEASPAQMVVFYGTGKNAQWNGTGNLFDENPSCVAKAQICNIDATSVEGNLWLSMATIVERSPNNTAAFRVVVNGTDVIADNLDRSSVSQLDQGYSYYNLSAYAGTVFSVSIEAVLRTEEDAAAFGYLKIWQPETDLEMVRVQMPESPIAGTSAPLSIVVYNNSPQKLINIPVRYSANGGEFVSELVAGPVFPFDTMFYTFEHDVELAEVDVLYNIEVEVLNVADKNPANNKAVVRSFRNGSDYTQMLCGVSNVRLTATSTPQYFTDNGGKLGDYANECNSAITITTENVGKKIQLRVMECDIEEDWDYLYLHDGNSADSALLFELTGSNLITLQSTNGNDTSYSSIYARFVSDKNTVGAGFLIEYVEVDATASENTFALLSIENDPTDYTEAKPVVIKIQNNSTTDQENVGVRYRIGDGDWNEETIATLPVGESTHTFAKELKLKKEEFSFSLTAEILNSDDMPGDNIKKKTLYNDIYCVPVNNTNTSSASGLYVKSIASHDVSFTMQSVPRYVLTETRSTLLPVYVDYAANKIEVTLPRAVVNGQVGLWIDWDKDFVFDDAEGIVKDMTVGTVKYAFDIDASAREEGVYNMRVRVGSFAVTPCADAVADGQIGQTVDFSLEVKSGYQYFADIEVVDIIAQSGLNLGGAEEVSVVLINRGNKAAENISLKLVVDGAELTGVTGENVAQIAANDTITYVFAATADLSAFGNHTIEVISSMSDDDNPFNNSKQVVVIHTQSAATGESWMLSFDGKDDVVNAGTLNGANLQSFTYEAWINPNSCGGYGAGAPGFGRIFEGKGLTLFANGLATSTFYPMNCFVVSIDNGGSFCTAAETFKIGQWQHIAVSHDNTNHDVRIYINGVEVYDSTRTEITAVANNAANNLLIGNGSKLDRQFDGFIDNVRVWNIVRTPGEIRDDMNEATSLNGEAGLVAEFFFNEGVRTNTVINTADGSTASILNAYCDEGEQSIWQRYDVLSSFAVEGQVAEWQQTGSNSFIAEVESGYDIAALTPIFTTQFEGAVVSANGNAITSGVGAIDFSSPVTVSATYNHLGEDIVETYTYAIASQSKLLSFELPAAGISLSAPMPSVIEIEVDGAVDALATNFVLSGVGSVLINGQPQNSGVVVDYTNPVIIEVIGTSGMVNATYTVLVKQSQTITWGSMATNYTYGDPSFALAATSSTGARLAYESSNTEVIDINGGRAYIVGAGTATITARQLGGQCLKPSAAAETRTISVAKAQLHIYADTFSIDQSAQLPELTMSFSGFVNADDASKLNELPTPSTDAVVGTAGLYTISLAGGSDDNYDYVLHSAPLTIKPQEMYALTIGVMGNGAVVDGASIEVSGLALSTDANGKASTTLPVGKYAYRVSSVGFEPYADTVILKADVSVNVSLRAAQYIPITYTTDGNGTLLNANGIVIEPQLIVPGQNTMPVQVRAHNGYNFVKWSDGSTDNPRQDYNITAPATYTAEFAIKTFTVNYTAGEGGSISGQTTQTVDFGQSGTEVTAVADVGYIFKQWSDGKTNPTRSDLPVDNMTVKAEFDKVYAVPYTQTFDDDVVPAYWETVNNSGAYAEWTFAPNAVSNVSGLGTYTLKGSTPNCAVLNDFDYKGGANTNADLVTPLFDFTNFREVTVKFNHYHYNRWSAGTPVSTISFYYSVNGGDWNLIEQWQGSNNNPTEFKWTTQSADICDKNYVRFKFKFVNIIHKLASSYAGDACWIVDDFSVTGVPNADSYTVTYRAGKGGSLQSVNVNAEGVVTEVVNDGDNGPSVTAVADAGYVFVGWSDGITDATRQDVVTKPIDVTALFQLDCGMPITVLPWQYSFEQGLPDCWDAMANVGGNSRYGWFFENNMAEFYYMGTGVADGELTSAKFDLSGVTGDAYISFYSTFNNFKLYPEDVWFEYSDDDGATWTELWICDRTRTPHRVSGNSKYFYDTVSVKLPTLSNAMRFRWSFKGTTTGQVAGLWDIKNIEITTSDMGVIEYTSNDDGRYYLGQIAYNGQRNAKIRAIDAIGSDITVEAIPYVGYHFHSWNDGNKDALRTDRVTATPQAFEAEFVIDTFQFTYSVDANGALTMNDVNEVTHIQSIVYKGSGVAVKATPDDGYKFVRWSDGVTDNPRIDTDVRKDSSVVAMFAALRTFNIAATATPAEYGEVTGEGSYLEGEMVTLNATAKDGSAFVRWTSNGVTVSTANPFTFVATSDSSLVAEFDVAQFNLIYSATMGGYIDGQARQTISYGQDGTTVEAKAVEGYGYHFVQWNDGLTETTRTSTNVIANQLFEAQFELNSYELNYAADANGSISGEATQTVVHGKSGSMVEAVANHGYEFKQWSDGSTVNPRTDVNVQGDMDVTAIFEPVIYQFSIQVLDKDAKPVSGAKVTVGNNSPKTTDAEGYAIDSVAMGKHKVVIQKANFVDATYEYEVVSDTLVKVVLNHTGLRGVELENLTVYPNPTVGALQVEATGEVLVFNLVGQLLQRVPSQGKVLIDLSNYPAGTYIVRVGNAAARVIKQ